MCRSYISQFFFFAAEPCFGRSRVENFQNSWGGDPFPIRGKSRHRDASCKRSSKQTRKEAFPPMAMYQSEQCARARYNVFHLRRIRTQELVWVKTCMTIHLDPLGFYIRFFLFFFPLVSLFIGCGMHCARVLACSLAPQC